LTIRCPTTWRGGEELELVAAIAGEALAGLFAPLFPEPSVPAMIEAELVEAGRPAPGWVAPAWLDRSRISAAASRDVVERTAELAWAS
jgi:hypothetical protein